MIFRSAMVRDSVRAGTTDVKPAMTIALALIATVTLMAQQAAQPPPPTPGAYVAQLGAFETDAS